MKKEMEEIPDELNPDLMLNTIASELLIKIAKGEIDIQKLVRKQLSDRGIDDQRNWIGPDKARKYWEKYKNACLNQVSQDKKIIAGYSIRL